MYKERVKCKVLKVHYKVAKHKCDVHLGAHAHVDFMWGPDFCNKRKGRGSYVGVAILLSCGEPLGV